jgi:hypothetical protein
VESSENFSWLDLLDYMLDQDMTFNASTRISVGGIQLGNLDGRFNLRSLETFLRQHALEGLDADAVIRAAEEYLRQHRTQLDAEIHMTVASRQSAARPAWCY